MPDTHTDSTVVPRDRDLNACNDFYLECLASGDKLDATLLVYCSDELRISEESEIKIASAVDSSVRKGINNKTELLAYLKEILDSGQIVMECFVREEDTTTERELPEPADPAVETRETFDFAPRERTPEAEKAPVEMTWDADAYTVIEGLNTFFKLIESMMRHGLVINC